MIFGLDDYVIEQIKGVFKGYKDIDKVVLFGSRARNDFKKNSDIDLAIFSKNIDSKTLNMIRDDLYKINIIYKIDTVHFESIKNSNFKNNILNEGKVIY